MFIENNNNNLNINNINNIESNKINILDDDDYSESSLDQKIKKLQQKTFGKDKIANNDNNTGKEYYDYDYYLDNKTRDC